MPLVCAAFPERPILLCCPSRSSDLHHSVICYHESICLRFWFLQTHRQLPRRLHKASLLKSAECYRGLFEMHQLNSESEKPISSILRDPSAEVETLKQCVSRHHIYFWMPAHAFFSLPLLFCGGRVSTVCQYQSLFSFCPPTLASDWVSMGEVIRWKSIHERANEWMECLSFFSIKINRFWIIKSENGCDKPAKSCEILKGISMSYNLLNI